MDKRRVSNIAPAGGVYLDTTDKSGRVKSATSSKQMGLPSQWENTYRLEPEAGFPCIESTNIINAVLKKHLDGMSYVPEECNRLSSKIADEIKSSVKKALRSSRYKVVSYVTIGQAGPATIALASRCVWNDKVDTRAEGTFRSSSLYAVAMVYGLYLE